MAQLGIQLNADVIPEREHKDFELIPNNTWATLEIIESDVASSDEGHWLGLKFTAKVASGPFENQRVWGCITVQNTKDAQSEQWGQQEIGELARAIGRPQIDDSEDILGAVFDGRIGVRFPKKGAKDEKFGPKNVIREYRQAGQGGSKSGAAKGGDGTGGSPARQSAPAAAKAAPAAQDKPWKTRAA